jgi:hypothetical protein
MGLQSDNYTPYSIGRAIICSMYGRYVGPPLIVQNGYIPSGVL